MNLEVHNISNPNINKNLEINIDGVNYARIPIKTHILTGADKLEIVSADYFKPHAIPGDILFISEKAVACIQARAVPMAEIRPRRLARILCRFVHRSAYGIGLGIPETMEMALRECGVFRILLAAGVSIIGKIFRRRGWFYRVAGERARSIDGPTPYTLPPYNKYVVLGPKNPDNAAKIAATAAGHPVAIVDINDLGGNILGTSDPTIDRALLVRILADNPLGQASEQTPFGIIRQIT